MVSKGKILEIISFYLDKGKEETLTAYSLSEETFNRYYREYKKQFGSSIDLYSQLKDRFTVDELKALASGTGKETDSRTQVINFDCEEIVFGALTDSHIGSKYTDESYIVSALEEFEKQNCSFFIHAGDVTEGMSGRDGHTYELTHIGYKAQKEASVRLFSKWKKPAYYLSGNHDLWYMNKANIGADIVEDITQSIPNAVYLGQHEGDLIINGITLKLWHGEDTGSYATSYRIQKLIESLNEKELPDALFCGHTHKQGYFFERNIQAVTLGSIQKQSAWMRRKRLPAHCGFYIIKMGVKNNKIIWFEPRFYPFY
jgi:predicted phosphodiesterase